MHSYLVPCGVYVQTAHSDGNRVGGVGISDGGWGGVGVEGHTNKKREEKGSNNNKDPVKKHVADLTVKILAINIFQ